MDTNNGNGGHIGHARQALAAAETAYRELQVPIAEVEKQRDGVQREIVAWERTAANITSDISAEVELAARQRRVERLQAEIDRLRAEARPAAAALSRAQDRLLQLEQEQQAIEATHRILADVTHPDVLHLSVAEFLSRLGITRQLLRDLTGEAPPATPFDDVAAAHVEQVRCDTERQARDLQRLAQASERPRFAVEG